MKLVILRVVNYDEVEIQLFNRGYNSNFKQELFKNDLLGVAYLKLKETLSLRRSV